MADKFSALFEVEFESLNSVQGKLNRLVGGLKNSGIKLNFDTSEINNIMSDLTKLSRQQVNILPSGQITTLQRFNDELGRTISIRENLSKGIVGINIDDNITKKLQEEQKLINDIANAREKSELRRREEIKKTEQAQTDAINKALEGAKKEEQQVKEYIKLEQERLRLRQRSIEINRGSLLDGNVNSNISVGINNLDARTMEEARKRVSQLNSEITRMDQNARMRGLQVGQKNVMSFGESLKRTATSFGLFSSAYMIINQVTQSITHGVQTVIDMDTAMSDLAKTSGLASTELAQMRDVAVEMGQALGRSSIDIMNSMAEFGRQYKDVATISQMTEASVLGANVMDGTSADEVAKGLTTIINSLKLEANDAVTIIDSLNEVQNNYRVSADTMLGALSQVGSTASVAGASLQQLEGYITSIAVSTGKEGREIGNSLKALTTRIYKIGGTDPSEPGDPEEALAGVGVAVRDAEGNFRELNDILTDLDKKWKTMTDTQKISTAQVVAG